MGQCPDYRRIPILNLTQEEITALTSIGSIAFGEPMGDSLIDSWFKKKDQTAHLCIGDQGGGFLVVDNTHAQNGVYYVELVAVYPPTKGLGTALHEMAFNSIVKAGKGAITILTITQNPAEIMAFKKAANKLGQACFPFDRAMGINERDVVSNWLKNFRSRSEVNLDLDILYNFFRSWQPQIDRNIREGELSRFLLANSIDFDEFCNKRNAFILGFSFSK